MPDEWADSIRAMWQAGDNQAAVAACLATTRANPQSKSAFHFLARAYRQDNASDAARDALSKARDLGLGDLAWLRTRLSIAEASQDMQEIRDCCIALREEHQDNRIGVLVSLAKAHMHFCQWDVAMATVDEILRLDGTSVRGINLKYETMIRVAGADGIETALEGWIFGPEGQPDLTRMLIFLDAHSPAHKIASKRLLQRALDTWPDHPVVQTVIRRLGMTVTADGKLGESQGRSGETLKHLSRFRSIGPDLKDYANNHEVFLELEKTLYDQINEADLGRPLVVDDPEKDVIISEPGPAGEIAIVFTGARDHVMMPIAVLDAYFAAAGISAIYLKDHAKLLFCTGVGSLGADIDATHEGLHQLIRGFGGGNRITMYGISGGGIAAIRHGLMLNADRIVNFSGPTNATLEFIDRHKDQRARLLVNRLHEAVPNVDLVCRDMIEASPNRPPITMIYGADSPLDRAQAEDISGLENVELLALPGKVGHPVLRTIILIRELPDLIAGRMDGIRRHCKTT